MSYNVIKSMSINIKKHTYNYSIACNNVRPRRYETIKNNNLNCLLYDLSTWNSQYHWKWNAKLILITNLAYQYKEKYWWDRNEKTDLYHENNPRNWKMTEKYIKLNQEMIMEYKRIIESKNLYTVSVRWAMVVEVSNTWSVIGSYSNWEMPCKITELQLHHIKSRYKEVVETLSL